MVDLFLLVSDNLMKFSKAPSYSRFGLPEDWHCVWTTVSAQPDGDYSASLREEVYRWVPRDYEEIPFDRLVPQTGWVLRSEFQEFLTLYKASLAKSQRLGQAFLNHFHTRFTEPWPELFYCEDTNRSYALISERVF
jgi:hypothetical protein